MSLFVAKGLKLKMIIMSVISNNTN